MPAKVAVDVFKSPPVGNGRFKVERCSETVFVVGIWVPSTGLDRHGQPDFIDICETDGLEEAAMIAAALNGHPAAQEWPSRSVS